MRRPLCTALLIFLAVYVWLSSCPDAADRWEGLSGETVVLEGKAAQLYRPADGSRAGASFSLTQVSVVSGWNHSSDSEQFPQPTEKESILCYVKEGVPLPQTGSRVRVRGRALAFRRASNPGEFDYDAYQRIRNCIFTLRDAEILAESETYDRIGQFLYVCREQTAALFLRTLGEEDGALAAAMVLGEKKEVDAGIRALYKAAGISHLLAISGLHISLIGMGVFRLLQKARLPVWCAAPAAFFILFFYGVMTGMGVSVTRAILMFGLLLAARLLGRTADPITNLALAALGILLFHPAYSRDVGFRLSFSAVAGICMVTPVLQETGNRSNRALYRPAWLRGLGKSLFSGVTASLGVTLATLPFLLYGYFQWNPWSVLANLIVIPLMGVLLPLLFLLAGVGLIAQRFLFCQPVVCGIALAARGIFFLYKGICRGVLRLPGSVLHTGAPSGWQTAVYFAGLAALVWRGRRIGPALRLTLAALLTYVFLIRLPGNLRITMLDVGQGESVCVETPRHAFWLLDAGSSSKEKTGEFQIVPFLKYSGARALEGIFISHWDEDHVNALEDIFSWAQRERVKIGRLFLPDTDLEDEKLEEILALARRFEVKTERLRAGTRMETEALMVSCLHPEKGRPAADRNDSSLVLRLEAGAFSALFTGDLQEEGERRLVQACREKELDCDLLDAGHHGAANATGEELLQAVRPRILLISCGENNRYGHPAKETLDRVRNAGIPYYVTASCGAVTVEVSRDGLHIGTFLSGK